MSLSILSADCRSRLYRIVWETIEGESVHAFILAGSRAEAKYLLHKAIVLLGREPDDEPSLFNLNSFEDLVNEGISEDEDLRVFETGWSREDGEMRPNWMTRPLFLLHDPTLLGKWTELQADLAAQYTRDVIGRAGRGR
ncbi:hypothetical protein [Caballeronia sp. LjRoot31]|uniref:hypothetical protein n=1 Tax=Caballeronia sp. LjRoot31 TaxID=3342324 RepID=UPI003ED0EF93